MRLDSASAAVPQKSSDDNDGALNELRAENAQLKSLNLDAAEKLSETIQRLEAALGEEANS